MYHILICDDEQDIVNALKIYLSNPDFKLFEANTGLQALEVMAHEDIHLILLDIMMPEMDGMEVLDRLAAMGVEAAVVMISGHGDIQTAVECIKKGAFDFIQKPLDLNRILITIKNATENQCTVFGKKPGKIVE